MTSYYPQPSALKRSYLPTPVGAYDTILFSRMMDEQRVPGDDRDKRKCEDFVGLYSLDTGHGGIGTQRPLNEHTGR